MQWVLKKKKNHAQIPTPGEARTLELTIGKLTSPGLPFPWNEILQWAGVEETKSIAELQAALSRIVANPKKFHAALQEDSAVLSLDYDIEQEPQHLAWVESLLRDSEALRNCRFEVVPRRMSEREFWRCFLSALSTSVAGNQLHL